MFLKSLKITKFGGAIVRDIQFHQGLNLIVDETVIINGKETGNNVGKTTVLKLIDFCLGAKAKNIYTDQENKKNEYKAVKDFLIEDKVSIHLLLTWDLSQDRGDDVLIERNFLSRKDKIQRINGDDKTDEEFEGGLSDLLFPGHFGKKPTFRQIIAHNIRYDDLSMNNTLKNLNAFTRDDEYETLYLFLLGCDFEQGDAKQELLSQINIEEKFKKRLESEQTKSAYEVALETVQTEIDELERRKASLNLNPDFERDLDRLNQLKYEINKCSSDLGRLELRRELILEAEREMKSDISNIDLDQLRQLYRQATELVSGIQKTFEELHDFHNRMVASKTRFILHDLPTLEGNIRSRRDQLERLLVSERQLSGAIIKTDSFDVLERLVIELNAKHQKKGEYEKILEQLNTVDSTLTELNRSLTEIENELFSDEFALKIKEQVGKFNRHFSSVSEELYGEKYALKVDPKTVKGRKLYEFSTFNLNFSSGKKQGEISCFDIAYTIFADDENIPCMHFLLNDKKELMHDNQLIMIAQLVNSRGIQFVASILKDKLPEELDKDEYIILKLSQDNKLFKIE